MQRNSIDDFCIDCTEEVQHDLHLRAIADSDFDTRVCLITADTDGMKPNVLFTNEFSVCRDLIQSAVRASMTTLYSLEYIQQRLDTLRYAGFVQTEVRKRMKGITCSISVAESKVLAR